MKFSNTYVKLGDTFYQRTHPTGVSSPELFLWNTALAESLALSKNAFTPATLASLLAGNQLFEGADPIACAYAGHQFGYFNPQLGDGRAHLLGEVLDTSGYRWDIQLKGSGPTAFSRGGDGRCALKPAMREFIMSEALYALGVPTTRCLSVVTTGDPVYRETTQPGAIVARIAASHLRVGTFQFFAAKGDKTALKTLADYAIQRHYPEIHNQAANPYVALLDAVIDRHIQRAVHWMRIGFIHGVMNTDNMTISGETIDYGPCAMMGIYDPKTVYSSIDHNGRYAFGQQPQITHWNMARLAECLLGLIDANGITDQNAIKSLIDTFPERYEQSYQAMMAKKLGLLNPQADDMPLILAATDCLTHNKRDYTQSFDCLTESLTSNDGVEAAKQHWGDFYTQWSQRIQQQDDTIETVYGVMRAHNPVVIPRNHHMEAVLTACEQTGHPSAAEDFLDVLKTPYQSTEKTAQYQSLPSDHDASYETFCGT